MSDNENSPSPFWYPTRPKGNLLHTNEVAKVIAHPGQNARELAVRVRGLVNRGYLHPVAQDQNDKRGALLFDAASCVSAAVLSAAADSGLSGKEHFARISNALRAWSGNPGEGAPYCPAAHVYMEYRRNPEPADWGVELFTNRCTETDRLDYRAAIRQGEHGYLGSDVIMVPEDHVPVATLLLPLDGLLPEIAANLAKRKLT